MTPALRHLTRGLLRLSVLTLPAFLVVSVLNRLTDPEVYVVDSHSAVGDDDPISAAIFGTPRPGTRLDLLARPSFSVDHPSLGLWLLTLVTPFLIAAAISGGAVLLLRTLRDTERGAPFGLVGARRLRWVAVVIAVAGVASPLASAVGDWAVIGTVTPDHAGSPLGGWNPLVSLPWLTAALLLAVVADAFGIGTELADEVEGLV